MKKLIIAAALMMACAAQADVQWSWWLNGKDVKADVSLGIVNRIAAVDALEIALLYGGSPVSSGAQWSVFGINDSDSDCALQLSWLFNRGKDPCAQLSFINVAKKPGLDIGFINFADDATVQIGLLNFSKEGFLPVFPIINLSKHLFD